MNNMYNPNRFDCQMVNLPYPQLRVAGQNPEYAREMLSNMGSSNSEMSAVSLYFYNSLILAPDFSDFASCFEKISQQEMHHLDIFGTLALQLGADPRLWYVKRGKRVYWSPSYNSYPRDVKQLILNSINAEKAAIQKYSEQAESIRDQNIVENLNRIILDEQRHIEIFNQMYEKVSR